jgi:hypothetical protein
MHAKHNMDSLYPANSERASRHVELVRTLSSGLFDFPLLWLVWFSEGSHLEDERQLFNCRAVSRQHSATNRSGPQVQGGQVFHRFSAHVVPDTLDGE